jgi:beta-lactam-binding protein with PASTA domain
MGFKSFLISKAFFKHLAFIILLLVVIIFVTIKALDVYTDNGEFIILPNFEHCDADSLMVLSTKEYLQYAVIDSMYADERMPGTVVFQNPKPGAKVKAGRKIYLSIVAKTPELVKMPNLVDLSIRRAIDVLNYAHLKVDKIEFADDIALNAVLTQMYHGDTIQPDTLIPSGSSVKLIAGNGFNKSGITVPFLIGKTPENAHDLILKSSFNIGKIDTLWENFETQWRVYEQTPHVDPLEPVLYQIGNTIDIKVRSAMGYNFDSVLNYYQLPDSLRYDTILTEIINPDF